MTEATRRALDGLRDLSTIEWYAIPLMAFVFYIYTVEIKKARRSGRWDAVLAGVTLFGMDCVNESWNGWVLAISGYSAVWTAPGPTALRTMVGWNLEIVFMFLISGIVYFHSLADDPEDRPLLRRRDAWGWAVGYAAFSVFVELLLNAGGHLVWAYPWWNASFGGVWLIFLFGYFHFYVAVILVLSLKTMKKRLLAISAIYGVAVVMNVIGFGVMGWRY